MLVTAVGIATLLAICTVKTSAFAVFSKSSLAKDLTRYVAREREVRLYDGKQRQLEDALREDAEEIAKEYKQIALSGFISQASNFANSKIFVNIFEKGFVEGLKALTDDLKYAKKRLVGPKTVYSGLIDKLSYEAIQGDEELELALADMDAWVAYNVTTEQLPIYAALAAKLKLKRVVFGVSCTTAEDQGADVTFDSVCDLLKSSNTAYTIIKYAPPRPMQEAKFPYRVVRAGLPLPTKVEGDSNSAPALSLDDLLRVMTEVIDLPKTFNNVYGLGPGCQLDTEILVYMKGRGWPERVQVAVLMGDMMESIEKKYEAEKEAVAAKQDELAKLPKPKSISNEWDFASFDSGKSTWS